MIAAIAPQFFTADLAATLQYYKDKLGFETQFIYGESAVYAGAIRDGKSIFFRCVDSAMIQSPDKYGEEFLDAYLIAEDINTLYSEYQSHEVEFSREIGSMPWAFREFVVKDCDGRLFCLGQSTEYGRTDQPSELLPSGLSILKHGRIPGLSTTNRPPLKA